MLQDAKLDFLNIVCLSQVPFVKEVKIFGNFILLHFKGILSKKINIFWVSSIIKLSIFSAISFFICLKFCRGFSWNQKPNFRH